MEKHKPKLILITGGARSGKSSFAESLAQKMSENIAYIATAQVFDEEMGERISEHRKRRPKNWETYEEPEQVDRIIQDIGSKTGVIIIDCMALLVSNLISDYNEKSSREVFACKVEEKIEHIVEASLKCQATVIIVSNEVGSGLVPANPIGRFYRDILGRANQSIARNADLVYLLVAGIPLLVKGNKDE
jgi:adenosylcobinamide kinase/adenosylcobinamide-phosphate guanylyltransferase